MLFYRYTVYYRLSCINKYTCINKLNLLISVNILMSILFFDVYLQPCVNLFIVLLNKGVLRIWNYQVRL